ncbi:DNA topoisomerase IV subunit B [Candidatus Heimdallarchaeota archaeon B3_Heim]|nr:MAG: DNA topoisomerase IV subunit B [Candidatus Heimdallarchaeota archaeon B3_Heim]
MSSEYDASSIQVLEGLEAVRRRPAMYIGSIDENGLHHLVWEIVDNSVDEAMADVCDNIIVILSQTEHGQESITVQDNGRGIPTEIHPHYNISSLELVTTRLHSGGKFDHESYKVSGGLHGVGIAVVNALSRWMQVKVKRNNRVQMQEYVRGETISHGVISVEEEWDHESGTYITFIPDPEIFEVTRVDVVTIRNRLRELAFLNKGLTITLIDERKHDLPISESQSDLGENETQTQSETTEDLGSESPVNKWIYHFDGGIKAYVDQLAVTRIHDDIPYFDVNVEKMQVEVALVYDRSERDLINTFTNNINTRHGGTHLSGFKSGLTRALNAYVLKNEQLIRNPHLKKGLKEKRSIFTGNDVREGLVAVVSVKIMNPQFEGQTKSKLGNSEVKGVVESCVYENVLKFLDEHPESSRSIIEKCEAAATLRMKFRQIREAVRKTQGKGSGKLVDCAVSDPAKREIFLVEGDSAGGSAIEGRFSEFQAILPLRGKVINVEKARLEKAMKNKEILEIIRAIGAGYKENFRIEKVRYHKIVLLMDADIDGHHIICLLLTFFFRYMPELIDEGYLYIAQPPLFRVKKGNKEVYVVSEQERDEIIQSWGGKTEISRFKGLGEMNPIQLRETVMDPEKRILLQVTRKNLIDAERMFVTLMGEEVAPRREFIEAHALEVENLDI